MNREHRVLLAQEQEHQGGLLLLRPSLANAAGVPGQFVGCDYLRQVSHQHQSPSSLHNQLLGSGNGRNRQSLSSSFLPSLQLK